MKGDKTTTLALIAAAVILAIVGIKSFLDYKIAQLDRQGGEEGAKVSENGSPPALPPPVASTSPDETPLSEDPEFQASIDQMPRDVLPPIPEALLTEPPTGPDPASPGARQTELEMYRARLEKIRAEGTAPSPSATPGTPVPSLAAGSTSTSGSLPPMPAELRDSLVPAPVASPVAPRDPNLPGSAVAAIDPEATAEGGSVPPPEFPTGPNATPLVGPVGDTPGSAPSPPVQTAAEIAALEEQVRRQPALAKVVSYDPEWAILVLSSGAESNIRPEMRFAVRRGVEILGFIKVTEVESNQSIAELMSANKHSPTARKPKPGDEVIAFNLF